jgi:hypothetical protein
MERLASVRIGSPMAPWGRVNPFPCAGTLPQRIVGYRGHWSAAKSLALLLDVAIAQFVPVCRQEKRVVISAYTYCIPPLMIPRVYCHIKSFQRASSVDKPWPGGEKRMDGRASPHHSTECDGVVSPPVCATGLSLIARGGLIGAAPRGQPRTSAVTLRQGRNGLSARRMAVWYTFCAPSLCRHAHRECMRSAVRDVIPTIPATACHQRNDVERYSRCTQGLSS